MKVETDRFGVFELEEKNKIKFPSGLPGFEELHEFMILKILDTRPIYWLQSIENKFISLPVIIPFEIFEDYCIEIDDTEMHDLNIESQNDILVINVVVIPEDIKKMTVNMAAPIIINAKHGTGRQIIIDSGELSVRHPVYEDIMRTLSGGDADAGTDSQEG
jgi:flagellar assembly factor FliW